MGVFSCPHEEKRRNMAKKAIKTYLRAAIESGFEFITRRFENLGELNRNFHAQRAWIFEKLEKKADFKRRLAKVLEVLKMHSCKYIGISFLTENRLCEAYEEQFGESISKRTAGSYVKQLREIGFITTMPAKREDGKQTANIVIIERFEAEGLVEKGVDCAIAAAGEREEPQNGASSRGENRSENLAHKEPEILRTEKTTSPSKTTYKEIKERMAKGPRLLNFVPRWFKERIGCASRGPKEIHEFWKVSRHLERRTFGAVMNADEWQEVVGRATREFYLSAKAAAHGKFKMDNPFGFFHAVLEAEGYAYVRRQVHESSDLFYDWLQDQE